MSATELLVIVGGLLLGFGVVSLLTGKKRPVPPLVPAFEQPRFASPAWHEVLELPPSATTQDIREAYQRLIGQYHPDKVATLGTELQALAERKSQEINAAYRDALRAHGIDA